MARFRLRPDGRVKLSENDVEFACLQLLGYRGFYPIRLQVGLFIPATREVIRALKEAGVRFRCVTLGEEGRPDYIVPAAGSFFLETKRPGGKLESTQKQKIWELEKIWRLPTLVVDNVEDLVVWLDQNIKR